MVCMFEGLCVHPHPSPEFLPEHGTPAGAVFDVMLQGGHGEA